MNSQTDKENKEIQKANKKNKSIAEKADKLIRGDIENNSIHHQVNNHYVLGYN